MNYKIFLNVEMKSFDFEGEEYINLSLNKKTKKIELNYCDLEVLDCKVFLKKREIGSKFYLDPKKEKIIIFLKDPVKGRIKLFLKWRGKISDKLVGLYKSKYDSKYLATTQFEACHARKMFPCFDKPDKKATFELKVKVEKEYDAVSNMPLKKVYYDEDKKVFEFKKTLPMSTYLLYLGIGKFEFLESNYKNTKIRVITTPGKIKYGKFGLESAKKVLKFFEDYFGIRYALPKLDLIAIPDFAAGAMENWGAITFREIYLIFDKKFSSNIIKQRIFEVIAHEIAHQWFGNLVTMKWWEDLWLNESFATFLAYKAMDKIYPEWKVWEKFMDETFEEALRYDSLNSTHPILVKIKEEKEAEEIFDKISYDKGASILKMIENFLGEEDFRKGLNYYLKNFKFSNAEAKDFWKSLSKFSKFKVESIMEDWIKKKGFPLIEVKEVRDGTILRQKRYCIEKNKKERWKIPLIIKSNNKKTKKLFEDYEMKINLKDAIINSDFIAPIRIKYPLSKLKDLIKKDLNVYEKFGILNSLYSFLISRKIELEEYLDFSKEFFDDKSYLMSKSISDNLIELNILLPENKNIKKEIFEFHKNKADWLKWPRKNEEEWISILRGIIFSRLGFFDKHFGKRLASLFKNYKDVNKDLKSAVCFNYAYYAKNKDFKSLIKRYEKEENVEEKRRFLISLTYLQKKPLIKKAINYVWSENVKKQDAFLAIIQFGSNEKSRKLIFDWFFKNFEEIKKAYAGSHIFGRIIEEFLPYACLNNLDFVKEFFRKINLKELGIQKSYKVGFENLLINQKFVDWINKR